MPLNWLADTQLCDPASVRSRNSEKVVAPQSQQPHNLGLACWELNGTDLVWGDWSCVVFNSGWWEFKWWNTAACMVKMNENDAIAAIVWFLSGILVACRQVAASRSCCAISPSGPLSHAIKPLLIIFHASRSPLLKNWISRMFERKTTFCGQSLPISDILLSGLPQMLYSSSCSNSKDCFRGWVLKEMRDIAMSSQRAEFPRTASEQIWRNVVSNQLWKGWKNKSKLSFKPILNSSHDDGHWRDLARPFLTQYQAAWSQLHIATRLRAKRSQAAASFS